MKNAIDGLTSKLDVAEKESLSLRISQEKPAKKKTERTKTEKKNSEYLRTVGQLSQKAQDIQGEEREERRNS